MSDFVRTTGGLLQLRNKTVSSADHHRIRQVAAILGLAIPSAPAAPSRRGPRQQHQLPTPSWREPMDLQATLPAVFT